MSQKGCERKENDEQMQNMLYSIFCGGGVESLKILPLPHQAEGAV
jgi:hypothetical protein